MGLNIKNQEVERLAAEVAHLTGTSKTEAIRQALAEKRAKLTKSRKEAMADLLAHLEKEVWPKVPKELRQRGLSKQDIEDAVGFGPGGF